MSRYMVRGYTRSSDVLTSSLWGAYSIKRVLGSYGGPVMRVRRSSDNAEQDIGFSGESLDVSALSSFVGAGDGFVVTWYDQSGAGNNVTQSTASKQPMIVDAGLYLEQIIFDGSDDYFYSSNNSGATNAFSAVVAGRGLIGGGNFLGSSNQIDSFVYHPNSGVNFGTAYYTSLADRHGIIGVTSGAGANVVKENNALTWDSTVSFSMNSAGSGPTDEMVLYAEGSAATGGTSSGSGIATGLATGPWNMGGLATVSAAVALSTVLIYESVLSAGDMTSLHNLIKTSGMYKPDRLDSFTSNLWGLYSLRRLRSSYAGNAIRVRRSSDNTEQDIGFSSGLLNTTSLLSFVGAGSGYVTKWYDQSGSGNDFAQATTARQPRIVNSGVLETMNGVPAVYFTGSPANGLDTTATCGNVSAITAYISARHIGTSGALIELSPNNNSYNGFLFDVGSNKVNVGTHQNPSNYAVSNFNLGAAGQVLAAVMDRTQTSGANQSRLYSGGRLQTRASAYEPGAIPSGNFDNTAFHLGDRLGGGYAMTGHVEMVALYTGTAHSASTVAQITRSLS